MHYLKALCTGVMLCLCAGAYAQDIVEPDEEGWHWYAATPPDEPEEERKPPPKPVWREENATELRKSFQKAW